MQKSCEEKQVLSTASIYPIRYLAPESRSEILLPPEVRHSVVSGICSETGRVDPDCFDNAFDFVTAEIEANELPPFLRSQFFNSYLVRPVTGYIFR